MRTRSLAASAALLAALLVASQQLVAEGPCFPRTIGRTHIAALVITPEELRSATSELDLQKRCLVWELQVQPKAEFAPAPRQPVIVAELPVAGSRAVRKVPLAAVISGQPRGFRGAFEGITLLGPLSR